MSGDGGRRDRGEFRVGGEYTLELGGRGLGLRCRFDGGGGERRGRGRRGVILVRREGGVGGGVVGHDSIEGGEIGS